MKTHATIMERIEAIQVLGHYRDTIKNDAIYASSPEDLHLGKTTRALDAIIAGLAAVCNLVESEKKETEQ